MSQSAKLRAGVPAERGECSPGGKFVYVPYLFTHFKILDDGGLIISRDGNNTLYKATR